MITNVVTLSSASVIPARSIGPDDRGRMFLVDCTNSFGGFNMPDPARFGFGFMGMQKIDESANPLQMFFSSPFYCAGYDYYSLHINGDTQLFGCEGTRWFPMPFGSSKKRFFAEHRTLIASQGQTVYQSLTTDRHALIRCTADSANITITLPVKTAFAPNRGGMGHVITPPGNYSPTWFCGILRTGASTPGRSVIVQTSDGTAVNNATGFTMTEANEMRLVDFDSSEWLGHKLLTS